MRFMEDLAGDFEASPSVGSGGQTPASREHGQTRRKGSDVGSWHHALPSCTATGPLSRYLDQRRG